MSAPLVQPEGSRIERRPVSARELIFHIPASGHWGGLLGGTIILNAIVWPSLVALWLMGDLEKHWGKTVLFTLVFGGLGIGLAWFAVTARYASQSLHLSPELVRLQRRLFGFQRMYEIENAAIVSVQKAEFYKKNYQPVFGIEIKTLSRRIRFGSLLNENEKNWLCAEIRTFLRPHSREIVAPKHTR